MLDQWRSRRVVLDGRLAWLPGGHPALEPFHCQRPHLALRRTEAGRARSQASFPTVAQVRAPFHGALQSQAWGMSMWNVSLSICRALTAASIMRRGRLWLPSMDQLLSPGHDNQQWHDERRWWTTSSGGRTRRSPPATRTAPRTSGRCRGTGAGRGGYPPAWRRPTAPSSRRTVPTVSRQRQEQTSTRLWAIVNRLRNELARGDHRRISLC